ncbi:MULTISPECIES: YihY/virulence factor BrkB family protein [Marinicauda]|jgi:membrane protein|uniref:YihY/virulence factor BrkB family protein n=1 Tax=Marinicauda pacifica TaxID=1133559 RepID=A0A4S2HFC6_9PROT|nr:MULTISPECIES: YihY/virulence factor BrkB family protein [Marinicauda]TGY94521.1 YihY/virulence factor BrkB family protein [Marinicauda pacifica]
MHRKLIKLGQEVSERAMAIPPIAIGVKAINRMMAREVMLFAGGASFFGLLALIPAVLVGASVYGLMFSASDALNQLSALRIAEIMPPTAYQFIQRMVSDLAGTPTLSLTVQSLVAIAILLFAAGRGAKAIIAGLNQIARKGDIRNIVHFNLIAMGAVLAAGFLLIGANLLILTVPNLLRPFLSALGFAQADISPIINEWTVAGGTMILALGLLYRYVMQRAGETSWRASFTGAAIATLIWLAISKGFTLYVSTIVNPTTYGPLGALIVFLLWIYWASYAVFFGGALAVEIDRQAGRDIGDSSKA